MRRPAQVGAIAKASVYPARSVRGFSLIDILVSLSVIALLISILLPTLSAAQEATRRIACASNMRQQGLAMQNYAFGHLDSLPTSVFDARTRDESPSAEETIYLRLDATKRVATFGALHARRNPSTFDSDDRRDGLVWDGLGKLYSEEYVSHHACFYCPSHHGNHSEQVYRPQFLDLHNQQLTVGSREIAGNFQLRLGLQKKRLHDLNSQVSLVSDAVRTQEDYNHINGNNLFRADLSVTWFADTNGQLWNTLASGDEKDTRILRSAVGKAWEILDGGNFDPVAPR
ncbi:MAG: type II secretion system protein [Phycisphaerales bacterium]|nr:type II secretion system protein [Phycisphaerales bacterium]